jgi:hypothetical protein
MTRVVLGVAIAVASAAAAGCARGAPEPPPPAWQVRGPGGQQAIAVGTTAPELTRRDCLRRRATPASPPSGSRSRHGQAWTNGIFQREYQQAPKPWCVNCHAPTDRAARAGWRAGDPRLAAQGVSCATCHVRGGRLVAKAPRRGVAARHRRRRQLRHAGVLRRLPRVHVPDPRRGRPRGGDDRSPDADDGDVVRGRALRARAGRVPDLPRLAPRSRVPRRPRARDAGRGVRRELVPAGRRARGRADQRGGRAPHPDRRHPPPPAVAGVAVVGARPGVWEGVLRAALRARPTTAASARCGTRAIDAQGASRRFTVELAALADGEPAADPAEPINLELTYVFIADEFPRPGRAPSEATATQLLAWRTAVDDLPTCPPLMPPAPGRADAAAPGPPATRRAPTPR